MGVLRDLDWAMGQLGFKRRDTTARWLRRYGVRVVRGRFLEADFYAIWSRQRVDLSAVRESMR